MSLLRGPIRLLLLFALAGLAGCGDSGNARSRTEARNEHFDPIRKKNAEKFLKAQPGKVIPPAAER